MTGQASKVSKGLRSIGANIVKLATSTGELSYTVNGATKTLSLLDSQTGEMKNTYEVLSEISKNWNEMTNAEQSSLALALSGKTQIDVFTSVLGNFQTAVDATGTALNSSGSAAKENSKYMESLEAKVNLLKKAWDDLVNNTIKSGFIASLLESGTAILKFADSDIGRSIGKIALLTTGLTLATKAIIAIGAASSSSGVLMLLGGLFSGAKNAAAAISLLTESMLANPLFLVATGGLLIFGLAELLNKTADSVENVDTKISNVNDKISTTKSKIDELKAQGASGSIIELYENQLVGLNKQLDDLQSHKFDLMFGETANKSTNKLGAGLGGYGVEPESNVKSLITQYNNLSEAAKNATNIKDFQKYSEQLASTKEDLTEYAETMFTAVENGQQLTDAQIDIYDQLVKISGGAKAAAEEQIFLAAKQTDSANTSNILTEQLYNQAKEAGLTDKAIYDLTARSVWFNNTKLDVTQKIAALRALATQAGITSGMLLLSDNAQLDQLRGMTKTNMYKYHMSYDQAAKLAQQQFVQQYISGIASVGAPDTGGGTEDIPDYSSTTIPDYSGGVVSGGATSTKEDNTDYWKKQFDDWYKLKQHQLAMGQLSEKDYLNQLDSMYKYYFSDLSKYQEEYWKYEEEVYKGRQELQDNLNESLDKQLEIEKALNELAKAKNKKVFVYKNGGFQYTQDIDAVSAAQSNLKSVRGYASGTSNALGGISKVGENGMELRILNKGDSIIPHNQAMNMMELSKYSPSQWMSNIKSAASDFMQSISIANITLPNVYNAQDFVKGIKNLAYQYATQRI